MNSTMITATNTLGQLQKQMDVISSNLANVDTSGFKSRQGTFSDLLFSAFDNQPTASAEVGRMTPNGIRQGVGARLGQVQMNGAQGSLKSTGRSLDFAFQTENQYFKVLSQKDQSVQYTRDGSFSLSPVSANESMLVTSEGNPVLDENNRPITVTGDVGKTAVNENGQLNVTLTDGSSQVFNLGVVQVNKPQYLEQKGSNLLGLAANVTGVRQSDVLTDLTGQQRGQISMAQGMLEQSNVNMSKEMTDLLNVQRSYQFQSRSITLADQMMGLINGIR